MLPRIPVRSIVARCNRLLGPGVTAFLLLPIPIFAVMTIGDSISGDSRAGRGSLLLPFPTSLVSESELVDPPGLSLGGVEIGAVEPGGISGLGSETQDHFTLSPLPSPF